MSEVDVRPAPTRGRSSTRGGRGSSSRGGPRGGRKLNGTASAANAGAATTMEESLEEQGELGEMKKKYLSELSMLRDMFPDWTDTDLVFALEEADGDIPATVDKITQGAVSQFAEVKKTKDRARSKAKDDPGAGATEKPNFASRGTRGRGGFEGSRGGRGRASDRGRGGHRGGRGGHATVNGTSKDAAAESVPTTESSAWDKPVNPLAPEGGWDTPAAPDIVKDAVGDATQIAWGNAATADSTTAAASESVKSSLVAEGAPKKSWASMFAKPKPAPVPVPTKQILTKPPSAAIADFDSLGGEADSQVEQFKPEPELTPSAPASHEPEELAALDPVTAPAVTVGRTRTTNEEEIKLSPSQVPLTEENVEHLPDASHPPATQTVVSTAGSMDPRNLTPLPTQPTPIGRPSLSGYATSANRLASAGGRSASFQRRVLEQQEAVVMPGHNALDRAAVQFGSMGLNGEPGLDVDDEREEPETRQPPQHSPPSQPRTSLPPAPKQTISAQEPVLAEAIPTPKQAPGLPPASAQNQQQMQDPSMTQSLSQEQQMGPAYHQYGRYGQPGLQQDSGPPQQQKSYDPFGHQAQHNQYDQYGIHNQQGQPQQQQQSGFGGLSSAPSDYSSYYTSDQPRGAYNQYYGSSFGPQQDMRSQAGQTQSHDVAVGQQRSASGFGAGPNDSAFASQAPHQQAQSRFGDIPGSGHNTPNPLGGQQSVPNAQQPQQQSMHQAQGPQGGYGAGSGFPYGHPYYNSPYATAYQNQFGYTPPQVQGYGGGFPGKQQGGMYGAPHGYGVGSQSSYDQHSSSPANSNAFGQNQQGGAMRSTSGMSAGLNGLEEYARGTTQSTSHQQGSGFGGMSSDPFARSTSGFGQGGYGQQSMSTGPEDSLKPFNESKTGPSPTLGQPGRPGSAANNTASTSQSGLPPPQGQHSSFGGYPGFPGQSSQYGGLGGLGSHQPGQGGGMGGQNGYASYGGFGQTYGGYGTSRGGWGANYSQH